MLLERVHCVRDVFPVVLVSGGSSGREARSRGASETAATAAAGRGLRGALGVEAERDATVCAFVYWLLDSSGLARGNGGGIARGDGDFVEFGANRRDAPEVARRLFQGGGEPLAIKDNKRRGEKGAHILVKFCCLRLGFLGCPPPCVYGAGDLQSQRHLLVAYRSRATPHTVGRESISSLSPTARNAITSRRRGRERRRDRRRVEGSCGEV